LATCFSTRNDSKDGFEFITPVKSYPENSIGLYYMTGNVGGITADFFSVNYFDEIDISKFLLNFKGSNKSSSLTKPLWTESP
jgi:formylglycine-generating enzyme required for sulfatase activity